MSEVESAEEFADFACNNAGDADAIIERLQQRDAAIAAEAREEGRAEALRDALGASRRAANRPIDNPDTIFAIEAAIRALDGFPNDGEG